MNAPTSPAKPFVLRSSMPLTTAWIDGRRVAWGKTHVNDMIRAGLSGERGCFYAIEAGYIVGAPFDWDEETVTAMTMGILSGAQYLAAMRDPKDKRCLVAMRDAAKPKD